MTRPKELWEEEARKLGGEALVDVINDIRGSLHEILERLDGMDNRHIQAENSIARLYSGFPGADIEGHGRYHQTVIDMLNEKRAFYASVKEKTVSGLVWSGMVFVGLAVWAYIKSKLFL